MFKKRKYSNGYAVWENGLVVHDRDVARFVKQHLRFMDRFNIRRVTEASLLAFSMLSGSVEMPKKINWKF